MATRKFLSEVRDMEVKSEAETGVSGQDYYQVRCKMALLQKVRAVSGVVGLT